MNLKANKVMQQGCFYHSLFTSKFDDHLSPDFLRFVISCIFWDTPSEKNGLWQLPKVSCAFKPVGDVNNISVKRVVLWAAHSGRCWKGTKMCCALRGLFQTLTINIKCFCSDTNNASKVNFDLRSSQAWGHL